MFERVAKIITDSVTSIVMINLAFPTANGFETTIPPMQTELDETPPQAFDGAVIHGFLGSLLRNNESTEPSSTVTSQPAGRPKRMTKKSRKQRPRVRLFRKYFE